MQKSLGLVARRSLLVLMASGLVHLTIGGKAVAQARPKPKDAVKSSDPHALPARVRQMLGLIEAAIQSGNIEELREAADWNEMKPDFGGADVADPIAYWKARSADGSGRETLDVLAALLGGVPAVLPYGRDVENNRLFVWPGFSERRLDQLGAADQVWFERLVAEPERAAMIARGTYSGWRLVLGADGTWHAFRRGE